MSNNTWDQIQTMDWSHATRPQEFVLRVSTTGCGCCSESELVYTAEDALRLLRQYVHEHETELTELRAQIGRIEAAGTIVQ